MAINKTTLTLPFLLATLLLSQCFSLPLPASSRYAFRGTPGNVCPSVCYSDSEYGQLIAQWQCEGREQYCAVDTCSTGGYQCTARPTQRMATVFARSGPKGASIHLNGAKVKHVYGPGLTVAIVNPRSGRVTSIKSIVSAHEAARFVNADIPHGAFVVAVLHGKNLFAGNDELAQLWKEKLGANAVNKLQALGEKGGRSKNNYVLVAQHGVPFANKAEMVSENPTQDAVVNIRLPLQAVRSLKSVYE